jgi:hypothetical protein
MNDTSFGSYYLDGVLLYRDEAAAEVRRYLLDNNYITSNGFFIVNGKPYTENEDVHHFVSPISDGDQHITWFLGSIPMSKLTYSLFLKKGKLRADNLPVKRLTAVLPHLKFPDSLFYFLVERPFEGWIIKTTDDISHATFATNNKIFLIDVNKFVPKYCEYLHKSHRPGREREYLFDFVRLMHLADMNKENSHKVYGRTSYSRHIMIKDLVSRILADSKDCIQPEPVACPF